MEKLQQKINLALRVQIINNILNNVKLREFKNTINFELKSNPALKNHWLVGFSDADPSFQIKLINRNNRTEVILNLALRVQIDQKNHNILFLIQKFRGANIGYRKSQATYYYGSTQFWFSSKCCKLFWLFPSII